MLIPGVLGYSACHNNLGGVAPPPESPTPNPRESHPRTCNSRIKKFTIPSDRSETLKPPPPAINPNPPRRYYYDVQSKQENNLIWVCLAFGANPGPGRCPLDLCPGTVEFTSVFASVASVAVSFLLKIIIWNPVKQKNEKCTP